MASLFSLARSAAPRSSMRAAVGSASRLNMARTATASPASLKNTFVTWAPTSEPQLSSVQQNPGPPPPVENIGVDAV